MAPTTLFPRVSLRPPRQSACIAAYGSAALSFRRFGNVWQLSLKDSALISVTGLAELMRSSQVAAGSTRQYFLFYIVGGALYLILTSLSDRVFNGAERKANRSMPASAMGQA